MAGVVPGFETKRTVWMPCLEGINESDLLNLDHPVNTVPTNQNNFYSQPLDPLLIIIITHSRVSLLPPSLDSQTNPQAVVKRVRVRVRERERVGKLQRSIDTYLELDRSVERSVVRRPIQRWRTTTNAEKQRWATNRRRRSPSGSSSTLPLEKFNTLLKVLFPCFYQCIWKSICFLSSFGLGFPAFDKWIGFFAWLFADLLSVLSDENVYNEAASEAFPLYNKSHMICLDMPGTTGDVSLIILLISLMDLMFIWLFLG